MRVGILLSQLANQSVETTVWVPIGVSSGQQAGKLAAYSELCGQGIRPSWITSLESR